MKNIDTISYCPNLTLLTAIFGPNTALSQNNETTKIKIQTVIDKLCDEQKKLILYRYGFLDNCSHTEKETAIHFEISPKNAKQLEALALRALRHPSCSKQLKELVFMRQ